MFINDLVTLLTNEGIGVSGTTIFWSSGAVLPALNTPTSATGFITITATGGRPPWIMHNSVQTPAYVFPSAQIVARARTSAVASSLALATWTVCAKDTATGGYRRNFFVNSVWYISLDVMQSEPFDLGPDDAGRIRFAFNVTAEKRPL